MNLQEVIDNARNLLNEPLPTTRTFPDNTSSFYTDAILTTYTNLIQQEVQQEIIQADEDYFVTQTFLTVSAGVAEYSLPSTFIKARRLEDVRNASNPLEIFPVTINQRRDAQVGDIRRDSAGGQGGSYYLRGNQIILTDTPTFTDAQSIRLHYLYRLTDITASGSISEIPAEHHRLLVWGVVKLALFQQQSDTSLADKEYQTHLARMRQEIEGRQTQRPRRVARAVTSGG